MKGEVIDKVPINFRQLMDDLIEDHRLPLQNKQIMAQNNVEAGLSVFGDKEMLKIIFRNLFYDLVMRVIGLDQNLSPCFGSAGSA